MTADIGSTKVDEVTEAMRDVVLVDRHAIDETEVDNVDAELGVDHVAHGLLDVLGGCAGDEPRLGCLGHEWTPFCASACAVASFQAIQGSKAHLILAG